MKDYLIIQDYVRADHFVKKNGKEGLDYLSTKLGRELTSYLKQVGITKNDFEVQYAYNQIPQPKKVSKSGKQVFSYYDPKLSEAKESMDALNNAIVQGKPKVVIPTARLGCKMTLDVVSITKLRGVPEEVTFTHTETGEEYTTWVFPIFSVEYITAQPNNRGLFETDIQTLGRFVEQGEEAFRPKIGKYEVLEDDFSKVEELFTYIREHKPLVSWDLETNTLAPENKGSKVLVISISLEEGSGYTIIWDHKESKWTKEEKERLEELVKEFVANPEVYKVGQNIQYDIRFLMSAYGMKEFYNHMDTKIAYYLTVSQEASKSFRLSDIAHELTDMGGYDKPLEDFVAEDIKEKRKEKIVNEVDGSNYNYEWIPTGLLYPYAAGDVDATLRVHNKLMENIKTREQWLDLYMKFYPRLTVALARMESNGLRIDDDYAKELQAAFAEENDRLIELMREQPAVQELEEQHRFLYEQGLAEWEKPPAERDKGIADLRNRYKNKLIFNPNSPADKQRVLFKILGVKLPIHKDFVTDKGMQRRPRTPDDLNWDEYSTSKKVLEEIIGGRYSEEAKDVSRILLEYANIKTVRSTFVEKLPKRVLDDGNVHGSFNIVGTSTSRLSSSDPKS